MENDLNLEAFDPSFLEDGGGISGESSQRYGPFVEDTTEYYINPSEELTVESDTINPQIGDDSSGSSCVSGAGDPPSSGTWIMGSVGGVCQWIDTTTCS